MKNTDTQVNQILQLPSKTLNMFYMFKKIDERMENWTKELEYINKSQMEILPLNNAKTEVRNSEGY